MVRPIVLTVPTFSVTTKALLPSKTTLSVFPKQQRLQNLRIREYIKLFTPLLLMLVNVCTAAKNSLLSNSWLLAIKNYIWRILYFCTNVHELMTQKSCIMDSFRPDLQSLRFQFPNCDSCHIKWCSLETFCDTLDYADYAFTSSTGISCFIHLYIYSPLHSVLLSVPIN